MDVSPNLKKTLKKVRNISKYVGNSRTFRSVVKKHDMVYFGEAKSRDVSAMVRGITASNSQKDRYYCVGHVYGRDVIMLQRSDSFWGAKAGERETHTWNIITVDLKDSICLPHTYIVGRGRHGIGFRSAMSMRERDWTELPDNFIQEYSYKFRKRYHVYMSNYQAAAFWAMITPTVADRLASSFDMYDYELEDDTLYVYYLSRIPSMERLDTMLKAGAWLAGEVEKAYEASLLS